MDVNEEVEFRRRRIIIVTGVVVAVFLQGAVGKAVNFSLSREKPTRLVEIDLKEGETLTYRVNQHINMYGSDEQNVTMIVGIRVLNKTSEEYWFLMKSNLSQLGQNATKKDPNLTDYFLVQLHIASRTEPVVQTRSTCRVQQCRMMLANNVWPECMHGLQPRVLDFSSMPISERVLSAFLSTLMRLTVGLIVFFPFQYANVLLRPSSPAVNKPSESFEIFGPRHIHPELLGLVYSILKQLFPEVQRDLHEDVDGEMATGSNFPDPEESPLLPGSVKMHRKAKTLDHENLVFISNNFNEADFVNFSSEIDFNLNYSDSAFIHKRNGMITQSNASFSKQLIFGEPIHNKNGHQERLIKVAMISQVFLIELTNYFKEGEIESAKVHHFTRLSLSKSKATVSLKENQHNFSKDAVSNSSLTPSQSPLLQRSRRSSNLEVDQSATLFEKKILGVTVKAEARHWVQQGVKMGISVVLSIGSYNEPLFNEEYTWNELQNKQPTDSSVSRKIPSISFSIPAIMVFSIGVDFSLEFKLGLSKSYPQLLSSSSREFAVQVKPQAEVTAKIEGYLSAHGIKAGVYADGTIVRVGLLVTLLLQVYPSESFCTTMSANLTALELSAGLYYKWCNLFTCGSRKTILEFGTWDAISRNWKLMPTRCN